MNNVIPLLHVLEQMVVMMAGQGTGDVAPRSHGHMSSVRAELEEEDIVAQAMCSESGGFSTQVAGEEEHKQPEELEGYEEDDAEDPDTPWQYAMEVKAESPSKSLAQIARCMLTCLRSDS